MNTTTMRTAGVALIAALLLFACDGADGIDPPDTVDPTQPDTHSPTGSPTGSPTSSPEPDLQAFDSDTAAQLYVSWRNAVYGLPATSPEAIDVEAAGAAIVVPGSEAAEWLRQELELARERGVVVRGGIHAEPNSPLELTEDRATVAMCSSSDVRPTDVATGDPVADEAVDTSYAQFDVVFQRIDDVWLVEQADPSDERDCVPPSIDEAVTARWELFTEAWYERDRRGGGEELDQLTEVVTDDFADVLRDLPPRDPVPDPDPFTDFGLLVATRTSATGQACRSGGLETIEWVVVEEQWRVDFVGQAGEEAPPCP